MFLDFTLFHKLRGWGCSLFVHHFRIFWATWWTCSQKKPSFSEVVRALPSRDERCSYVTWLLRQAITQHHLSYNSLRKNAFRRFEGNFIGFYCRVNKYLWGDTIHDLYIESTASFRFSLKIHPRTTQLLSFVIFSIAMMKLQPFQVNASLSVQSYSISFQYSQSCFIFYEKIKTFTKF